MYFVIAFMFVFTTIGESSTQVTRTKTCFARNVTDWLEYTDNTLILKCHGRNDYVTATLKIGYRNARKDRELIKEEGDYIEDAAEDQRFIYAKKEATINLNSMKLNEKDGYRALYGVAENCTCIRERMLAKEAIAVAGGTEHFVNKDGFIKSLQFPFSYEDYKTMTMTTTLKTREGYGFHITVLKMDLPSLSKNGSCSYHQDFLKITCNKESNDIIENPIILCGSELETQPIQINCSEITLRLVNFEGAYYNGFLLRNRVIKLRVGDKKPSVAPIVISSKAQSSLAVETNGPPKFSANIGSTSDGNNITSLVFFGASICICIFTIFLVLGYFVIQRKQRQRQRYAGVPLENNGSIVGSTHSGASV